MKKIFNFSAISTQSDFPFKSYHANVQKTTMHVNWNRSAQAEGTLFTLKLKRANERNARNTSVPSQNKRKKKQLWVRYTHIHTPECTMYAMMHVKQKKAENDPQVFVQFIHI